MFGGPGEIDGVDDATVGVVMAEFEPNYDLLSPRPDPVIGRPRRVPARLPEDDDVLGVGGWLNRLAPNGAEKEEYECG